MTVGFTGVRRNRVVNLRSDILVGEMLAECIAVGCSNDEEVPSGFGPLRDSGEENRVASRERRELSDVSVGEVASGRLLLIGP